MDLTGLSIEELQEKLTAAEGYEERAAIRAELRRQKKERGVQSTAIISRKGAPTYNRFGGSSGSPRGRAVTVSISSTAKSKEPRQNQKKAKDDSAVRPVTSPQMVPDTDKKTTPTFSPEPATTSNDTPVKSPPPAESPPTVKSPVTVESPPTAKSPPPIKSPPTVKSPPPVKSPPTVESPPPSSSTTLDEADIGIKKTGQTTNKQLSTKQSSSTKPTNEKAEFQGFQLRKTGLSVNDKGHSNKSKMTSSTTEQVPYSSSTTYSQSKTYSPARNTPKKTRTQVSSDQAGDVTVDQLQQYLVAFVNQALSLDPPLPSAGRPFYNTCSQPDVICSLLNHAVPGTVDMRALSPNQEPDSREANMMLALESARAIGCHIGEDSTKLIERGEPQAIRQLVMDVVRAKVVHLPNMEDEPRETFEDPAKLFALLGVSVSNSMKEPVPDQFSPPPKSTPSPKRSPPPDSRGSFDSSLSYEERAALRRAEREERRRRGKH